MLVELSLEEIKILRSVLLGRTGLPDALSEDVRQRLVLKLHAALEGMQPGRADDEDESV
ncbi:MAG TPA: hypothetical protein VIM62_09215 [Acidobacteriaceae bacterium]